MSLPKCYSLFVCLDDCVASCSLWEDCMFESEDQRDDADEPQEGP